MSRPNSETVGIVFLSDLMYILRQINFHEILSQPVIKFVLNLNGTDEDRKRFKEALREEMTAQDLNSEYISEEQSHHTSNMG